jgi:hypothetical protein
MATSWRTEQCGHVGRSRRASPVPRVIGRPALTGLALAHGYDTAFWWIVGIFAGGAVIAGALLRSGPLHLQSASAQARDEEPAAAAQAGPCQA